MKKKIENRTDKSNKRWSQDEIEFIKTFYGKVKTDSIADVLSRSAIAVWQQCKTNGFKLQERIYSATPVETTFQGKVYHLQAFRYTRKENGATVDKTLVRKKIGRPRKYTLVNTPKKEQPMAAHRRKAPMVEKKPDLTKQTKEIPAFVPPEGKKLVPKEPGSKIMVYR